MTDMPDRIWTVHWNTDGAVMNGAWADTVRHFGGGVEYVRADIHRSLALDALASETQAADAYAAQLKAEAMAEKLAAALTQIRNYCANGPISQGEINCAVWAGTALAEYEVSK